MYKGIAYNAQRLFPYPYSCSNCSGPRPPQRQCPPPGYGAVDIRDQPPAPPPVHPAAAPDVEQPNIAEGNELPGPPPVGPAANGGSAHEANDAVGSEQTQNIASLGTPELILSLGKSIEVQFNAVKSQSSTSTWSSVVDPSLTVKSSDSEEPKQTTSDSSQPVSMETKNGEQATPGEGETSQLTVSTVESLPKLKRKHKPSGLAQSKSAAGIKHSQPSSSDSDSEAQRKTRPPKSRSSASYSRDDPAGLAKDMTTTSTSDSSPVERSTEEQ